MKPNILFVDDEPLVLNGLRRMLRSHRKEWNISFANSGDEALSLFEERPYDIIISDMRMPKITGDILLQEVAERYPECVRLVLSGHAELSNIIDVVAPAHQFYAKPCDVNALSKSIKTIHGALQFTLDKDILPRLIQTQHFPSRPEAIEKLWDAFGQENSNLEDIYNIISSDISMTAQVLRLVNSSFFGKAKSTLDLGQAINTLGVEILKRLFKEANLFCSQNAVDSEMSRNTNHINALANELAERTKYIASKNHASPECLREAQSAAMLYFMGYLARSSAAESSAEVNSNELSTLLLTIWGFDEEIIDVIGQKGPVEHPKYGEISELLRQARLQP
ncbi:MAG: HDOD domain-containing protein [Pseudomonadota bacterium]